MGKGAKDEEQKKTRRTRTVEREDKCICNGNDPTCHSCAGTGKVTVVDTEVYYE